MGNKTVLQKIYDREFYKTVINEIDIIIQISEIEDNTYFRMIWSNDFYKGKNGNSIDEIRGDKEKNFNKKYNPLNEISVEEVTKVLQGEDKYYSIVHKYAFDNVSSWYYTIISTYEHNEKGYITRVLCASINLDGKIYDPGRFSNMTKEIALLKNKISFSQLSKTERKILQLVASGLSEKEIAEAQVRSVHTINTHLKSIRKKLNLNKNTELVKIAIETGFS
jgi:DNA-binding CsgD family transcriptional regulator